MKSFFRWTAVAAFVLGSAASAAAQGWSGPDATQEPWETAKLKVGPLFVAPTFDLRNLGVDNNVFRDETNPKQDLTATVAVNTKFGAHFKAFVLTLNQDNRYLWFRRYTTERSIDGGLNALAELRFQSFHPWIRWAKAKTHDRAGEEIDARAGRETPEIESGADFNFGMRTGATVSFRRHETRYDENEIFDGVDLKQALDNRQTFAHVSGRWAYTDSTNLTFGTEYSKNDFLLNPLRSGNNVSYFAGLDSRGDAPITGRVRLGYKVQQHEDPAVKDFRGPIGYGSLTTVLGDRVMMTVNGDRDIAYSYDDDFPFYVQQGGGVLFTIRTSTRLDLLTGARGEWLRYNNDYAREGADTAAARTDVASTVSAGFLYKMGGTETGSAFGLTLEQAQRDSPLAGKTYKTHRVLTNIKLAF